MQNNAQNSNSGVKRKVPGVPFTANDPRRNLKGRPKESEETKIIRKATKDFIKEYKESLAAALPDISPVLVKKAMTGDVPAIKEVSDRVMGKAKETRELKGNVKVTFSDVFNKDDTDEDE